jgi:hypothetical protein
MAVCTGLDRALCHDGGCRLDRLAKTASIQPRHDIVLRPAHS